MGCFTYIPVNRYVVVSSGHSCRTVEAFVVPPIGKAGATIICHNVDLASVRTTIRERLLMNELEGQRIGTIVANRGVVRILKSVRILTVYGG